MSDSTMGGQSRAVVEEVAKNNAEPFHLLGAYDSHRLQVEAQPGMIPTPRNILLAVITWYPVALSLTARLE
jgi:hypothetical protein